MTDLADRIRQRLGPDPRVSESRGFGGVMFLLSGNLLVSAKPDGRMLAHVGKAANDAALLEDGASQMVNGGRTMRGYVWVADYALETDEMLAAWIDRAMQHVTTLASK